VALALNEVRIVHGGLVTRSGQVYQAELFIPELGQDVEGPERSAARFSETGTGFACAKLSEAGSSRRVAQVVRVTQKSDGAGVANDPKNLTPNPFPSGKGNRIIGGSLSPSGKGTGSLNRRQAVMVVGGGSIGGGPP